MAIIQPNVTGRIVCNPGIWGGQPILEGTRIPVSLVVINYRYHGDIAGVIDDYPWVTSEAITNALDYYHTHRDEIDQYIREQDDENF